MATARGCDDPTDRFIKRVAAVRGDEICAEGEAVSEPVLVGQLAGISKASGGESFVVQNAGEIGRVLEKVSEDLAHGYLLSFAPPQAENNEWRTIEVTVHTKGARVHAREGYYPQSGTE